MCPRHGIDRDGRRPHRRARGAAPVALALAVAGCAGPPDRQAAVPDHPTYTRDVAPILWDNCGTCHRPGGAGPFSLLTYQAARRQATQIALVTGRRYMPPWLPEPVDPPFIGERRLTEAQIETLGRWVEQGAPEGDPDDLPPAPEWPSGWQLGRPDLVLRLDQGYVLPPGGADVFRNFVVPIEVDRTLWVRAVELRPGDPRVVHHAVMGIDRTPLSRSLDAEDPEPGFGGMEMGGARQPGGHFLGWTPGKVPDPGTPGMAWRIGPAVDMVLQLHMLPSGKPEPVAAEIGLYLAEGPPTLLPSVVMLSRTDIDIPAGEPAHPIRDSFEIPVDVELLGLYPHAHYLGNQLRAVATLPGGTERILLDIPDWDFNWQDDFRYSEPVPLPAGTVLSMRYTYDNSAANERNPHDPPQRVRYGPRSSDEMGSLLFQLLARDDEDRTRLQAAKARYNLDKYPEDQRRWKDMGLARHQEGKPDEAIGYYRRALALDPRYADGHYHLALALSEAGREDDALPHYREAVEIDPYHAMAHNDLGNLLVRRGRGREARAHLERAVRIQPDLAMAHYNLGVLSSGDGDHVTAIAHYGAALEIEPSWALAHSNHGTALQLTGRLDEAIAAYRRALEADPALAEAHNNLGLALGAAGQPDAALAHFREAVRLRPDFALAHNNLGNALLARGRRDDAARHFREALRIDPDHAEARSNLQRALDGSPGS